MFYTVVVVLFVFVTYCFVCNFQYGSFELTSFAVYMAAAAICVWFISKKLIFVFRNTETSELVIAFVLGFIIVSVVAVIIFILDNLFDIMSEISEMIVGDRESLVLVSVAVAVSAAMLDMFSNGTEEIISAIHEKLKQLF